MSIRHEGRRRGRISIVLAVVVVLGPGVALPSSADPLLQGGNETSSLSLVGPFMQGYDFRPTRDLELTSLGFWDNGSDGLPGTFQVGLWQSITGTLLASASIDTSDPLDGSTVVNGGSWRYETLGGAVPLTSGVFYTLAFQVGPGTLAADDTLFLDHASLSTFPDVQVFNTRRFFASHLLVFPTSTTTAGSLLPGNVNAQLAVPEPTTALLLATGLVGLALRKRRLH